MSCNTAFAQMGVDTGPDPMIDGAEDFGFNQDVPIDLTAPARSNFPTDFEQNLPALAQSVHRPERRGGHAAADGDGGGGGRQRRRGDGARTCSATSATPTATWSTPTSPTVWTTAMDQPTANLMREAMLGVVESGTATRLAVPGLRRGRQDRHRAARHRPAAVARVDHRLRRPPGEEPTIAIAVIVEGQPGASEQTGGRVAAPIAQAVLAAYLQGVTA